MTAHDTNHPGTTLILGGTGKTGRRVVNRLSALGQPVRIGSRRGHPPFDWEDSATWEPALKNVSAAYVNYYPDIAMPGAADRVGSFVDLALRHGVRRLVLLSGRGEEEAQRAEQILENSGADWTVVRASWFAQNFSENFLIDGILAGEVILPAGDVPEPFVDVDDIADVVVAALTREGHTGQVYEVTGPRMLTFAETVREIGNATGREIRYVRVSHDDFASVLNQQGVPGDIVWLIDYLFRTVLDGRNAYLTDGVQRALGRQPRDFAEYARDAAATGVWNVSSTSDDVHLAPAGLTG